VAQPRNALGLSVVHLKPLCALVIGCYALTVVSNLFKSGQYSEDDSPERTLWSLLLASSIKSTLAGAIAWARTYHKATQVVSVILSMLSTIELLTYVVYLISERSSDSCRNNDNDGWIITNYTALSYLTPPLESDADILRRRQTYCAADVVGPAVTSLLLVALNLIFIVVLIKVIRNPSQAYMMGEHTLPMGQAPYANNSKPPPGAPPGGRYTLEKHCGLITWLVGIFLFPFVCCCPCDTRETYVAPDNSRWTMHGARVEGGECC